MNYYTGEPVTVPLDPTLSPSENARKYFDRYGKLKQMCIRDRFAVGETKANLENMTSALAAMQMFQAMQNETELNKE